MKEKNVLTIQQAVQLARLRAWVMSFFIGLLFFLAVAAASRVPHYLVAPDYARLIGVILFGLLALVGLADNIQMHIRLRRIGCEFQER